MVTPADAEQRFLLNADLWYEIEDAHGEGGGAYVVQCLDDFGDSAIPVDRLLGVDVSGILYVGAAACFTDRVITLKKSVSPDHEDSGHKFGTRYKGSPSIQRRFPAKRLVVTLIESETPVAAENQIIRQYFQKYGELPPFNRRV